jgi:hypothetical protein
MYNKPSSGESIVGRSKDIIDETFIRFIKVKKPATLSKGLEVFPVDNLRTKIKHIKEDAFSPDTSIPCISTIK